MSHSKSVVNGRVKTAESLTFPKRLGQQQLEVEGSLAAEVEGSHQITRGFWAATESGTRVWSQIRRESSRLRCGQAEGSRPVQCVKEAEL